MKISPVTKKSYLSIWTLSIIATMPTSAIMIFILNIEGILVLAYHIPTVIIILIAQRIWYRYQFQICSNCYMQREFHNKTKYNLVEYPQLEPIVCNKFEKGKFK